MATSEYYKNNIELMKKATLYLERFLGY